MQVPLEMGWRRAQKVRLESAHTAESRATAEMAVPSSACSRCHIRRAVQVGLCAAIARQIQSAAPSHSGRPHELRRCWSRELRRWAECRENWMRPYIQPLIHQRVDWDLQEKCRKWKPVLTHPQSLLDVRSGIPDSK